MYWNVIQSVLKAQIDKIYSFIVVCVSCINDLGKEIEQNC